MRRLFVYLVHTPKAKLNSLRLTFLFCFWCWAAQSIAEITDFGHHHFLAVDTKENAIPGDIVTAMLQDERHYIWIGTMQGLVRYDGYKYHSYTSDPADPKAIIGDDIRTLWQAADGKIWVGTFAKGLSIYDPSSDDFINVPFATENTKGLSDGWVKAIAGDNKGNVFIGTDFGIDWLAADGTIKSTFKAIEGCFSAQDRMGVRALYTQNGQLWVSTESGTCLVDITTSTQELLSGTMQFTERDIQVVRYLTAQNGDIWLGTRSHGAFHWSVSEEKLTQITYLDNETNVDAFWVPELAQVNESELWLGTAGAGLLIVDIDSLRVKRKVQHNPLLEHSLGMDDIGALLHDRSGLLWVGTWGEGLYRYNAANPAFMTLRQDGSENGLTFKDVQSVLARRNGDVYVGTRGKGVDIFSPKKGKVKRITPEELGSGHIAEVEETADGSVWMGTRKMGVSRLLPDGNTIQHYNKANGFPADQVLTITENGQEGAYFGTDVGLVYWDAATDKFTHISQRTDSQEPFLQGIYSMAIDQDNMLWIGTGQGLFLYNRLSESLRQIDSLAVEAPLSNQNIITLLVDRDNKLWISTMTGVDVLEGWVDAKPIFKSINNQLGLSEHKVWGSIIEDNQGWIWSENYIINPFTMEAYPLVDSDGWENGNKWHGSLDKMPSGMLLFGGTSGLVIADPSKFRPWLNTPITHVTKYLVDGKAQPLTFGEVLVLGEQTKSFSLQLTALDFLEPTKTRYQYRLLGFNDSWTSVLTADRTARFTNLDPGQYELQFRVTNHTGDWLPPARFRVIKEAQWHQTKWFNIVLLISVFGIVYLLFRARLQSLQLQKHELDELVMARTAELEKANKDKGRIMGVVAHDIKNKISITTGYLDLLLMGGTSLKSSHYIDYVKKAHDASLVSSEIVEELRAFSKLNAEFDELETEEVDLSQFITSTIESFQPRALAKQVLLKTGQFGHGISYAINKTKFASILDNLLANAIKFTEPQGKVTLSLRRIENQISLEVSDTGIGISEANLPHIFEPFASTNRDSSENDTSSGLGLFIVKALVEQHSGTIKLKSTEGEGTHVTIRFPILG